MIRINLLPPEITQKRKDEQNWKYVIVGAVGVAIVLAAFYGVMLMLVQSKEADVAAVKQEAAQLQAQTTRFQIFQQKEADLTQRKAIYEAAKQGRIDWTRLLNEVALVIPSDIFLDTLAGNEAESGAATLNMDGKAVHMTIDDADKGNGFKSVAKLLVRLTELKDIDTVWLTSVAHPNGPHSLDPWSVTTKITSESTPTAGGQAPPPVTQ